MPKYRRTAMMRPMFDKLTKRTSITCYITKRGPLQTRIRKMLANMYTIPAHISSVSVDLYNESSGVNSEGSLYSYVIMIFN